MIGQPRAFGWEDKAIQEREWGLLVSQVRKKLQIDYKASYLDGIEQGLFEVIKKFGGIDNLRGKKILDIGCGSASSEDGLLFSPWFCRALQELGAHPVGVDIGDLEQEKFEHYQLDLSKPGALNIFPDHSFDAINIDSFLDSPSLRIRSSVPIGEIEKEIGSQAKRLLKPTGIFLNISNAGGLDIKPALGL
jgi:SAM-dependent methyltransferase